MSELSRRSVFRALPAIAYGAAPPVPSMLAATTSDPIICAVEAHRQAWKAFDDAVGQTEVRAEAEKRDLTAAERVIYAAASDAEEAAWSALLNEPCATLADARTKAAYLLECARMKGIAVQDEEFTALLWSTMGGTHA